jgi:hypothetical protein
MTSWPPITRDDLGAAAGRAGFDTVLPLLIRRLIAETAAGLVDLDMPGGSGVAAGGFDGVVTATASSTFVPEGMSVWELSVGGGQPKADEDYNKRTSAPDDADLSTVTYVQALLVPWTKARAWASSRSGEGRWREVRGYNLDRIHTWLDVAPATTAWLSEQLDKKLPGVRSLSGWWTDTWLPATRVPLEAAIVLAGREAAATELVGRLNSGQQWITLGGDLRADEVRAFVAAALASGTVADAAAHEARAVFVTDAESLARLAAQTQPLVMLLPSPALARELPVANPHQFIVAAAPRSLGDILVPRVHSQTVASLLEAAGLPGPVAQRLGTLARRSLLAVRRVLAYEKGPLTPAWAEHPDVVRRRLLLLGAWHAENAGDHEVVSACVGVAYERVQEAAIDLSAGSDLPFLGQVDDIWYVVSVEDAWTLLGGWVTADDVEAAGHAALEVLSEMDPALELDRDERWTAGVRGVRRRFSASLRTALAETLALAAVNPLVRGPQGATGAQWSNRIVTDLLARANADATYRTWESLTDVLPLLAEGAPAAFLDGMREGLRGTPPLHAAMFQDLETESGLLGSGSAHSSFLHALDVLAWMPEHLDDVADILAELAVLDPGGKYANRPASSLREVFSAWAPNTSADLDHRIRIIRRLEHAYPRVGRQLLLDLIPKGRGFQAVHAGPRFTEGHAPMRASRNDQQRVVAVAVDLLMSRLKDFPEDYPALIDKVGVLPPAQHTALVDHLRDLGGSSEDEALRAALYEALRAKVARHEEYADAAWALPADDLSDLIAVRDGLAPREPTRRHAWLFKSDWVVLGDVSPLPDHEKYDAEVLRRRASAVAEILADGGLEAVISFASSTDYPSIAGRALAACTDTFDAEMLAWLQGNTAPRCDVAAGYLTQRLRGDDGDLQTRFLDLAEDPLTRARILRFAGDPLAAWDLLEKLGPEVSDHYWREFHYYGLGQAFSTAAHPLRAAWALLDVSRPAAALDLLLIYLRGSDSLEAAEVAAAGFEKLLENGTTTEIGRLDSYHFEHLFALLARHRDDLGRQRVVNLEWQLFPALGFDADAPTLHRAIVEEPPFFVELVVAAFRPDTTRDEEAEDPEERERLRAIATRAWDVFRSLRLCPGVTEDGAVDRVALRAWVLESRQLLEAADRLRSGDGQIGELLANAPTSEHGSPVHEAVGELLEEVRSNDIDRGLARAIYNKRGVQTRGVLDGGADEWRLAAGLREQAVAAISAPRTRRLLDDLADTYESQARSEDEKAERRHQGLGW